MFIYKTTNLINGKIYIGKRHKDISGYLGSGTIFRNAVKKYGRENFIREILEDNIDDPDILCEREKYWILFFDSANLEIGYNLTIGGKGSYGFRHSDETKKRMSENAPDKSGENHPMFGKHQSEEAKEEISKKNKGKKRSDEVIKNQTEKMLGDKNPMYGKNHSEETKDKISKNNKGKKRSEEEKLKMAERAKGKKLSEETKEKMSNSAVGKKKNIKSTSKYVGVSWNKKSKKWNSTLYKNGIYYRIGLFNREIDAAIAWNKKAEELGVPQERLNIISPDAFFVISAYKNNIDWVYNYTDDFIILDKGGTLEESDKIFHIENVGYNLYDYFSFIINNYDNLPDFTAFLQGDPFPHCKKETFDNLIYNKCFTPLEDYSDIPESHSHKKDIDGGYLEINTSYYLYLKEPFKHKWYNSYDQFLGDMFIDAYHEDWIRFAPGAQYIVPRENILKYSKNFWNKLMGTVSYDPYPMEAFLIERALYTIFSAKLTERPL